MRAVYYEGSRRFRLGACQPEPPAAGEVRLEVAFCGVCGTDLHIALGHMDGRVPTPMVIGHEMSGRVAELGSDVSPELAVGDPVVVRPLDSRDETAADRGLSHIARKMRFLGIDSPGAFQASWTVPAFTIHKLPAETKLLLAAFVEPLAVACHDVRRGRLQPGETAVVIGCGPIGLLIALVGREAGAAVIVVEVDEERRAMASRLGLTVLNAEGDDVRAEVMERTGGAGADVVFEVSGSKSGALLMTGLSALRGRIVVVAIFAEPVPARLFDLFWSELEVIGARVYEPEDYERAIELVAGGLLPLQELVTSIEPLDRLPGFFEASSTGSRGMKTLIDCQA